MPTAYRRASARHDLVEHLVLANICLARNRVACVRSQRVAGAPKTLTMGEIRPTCSALP